MPIPPAAKVAFTATNLLALLAFASRALGQMGVDMEEAQSFAVAGVEIEAPLFEELFGDRSTKFFAHNTDSFLEDARISSGKDLQLLPKTTSLLEFEPPGASRDHRKRNANYSNP